MTKTESIAFNIESLSVLKKMPDELAGRFIKVIYQYHLDGTLPEMDFVLDMIVTPFINQNTKPQHTQLKMFDSPPPYMQLQTPQITFGDLAAADVLLNCDVSKCLLNYFGSKYYERTREQAAIGFHMDESIFKDWATAFNIWLVSIGTTQHTLKDWARHFPNWLRKQDISKNPKTLHEYEQGINKNRKGTNVRATGANVDDASAFEKLNRFS